MLLDDTHALMTQAELDQLAEYSCSLPTGTTIGKRWKCARHYYDRSQGWLLGEYVDHPNPKLVGIHWREILVV